ncbi:MAG: PilT/PilU family type 4a pilus ATPase [Alphaproteobacteria bacterium]|nr:PilT/PilU family type 4a pilus ATPase [Alphaproteobacteria bacterium]
MTNAEHIDTYLEAMVARQASDLYLTFDCPPSLRVTDRIEKRSDTPLNDADLDRYMRQLIQDNQIDEFESTLELNTAISWNARARFRINLYKQQQHIAITIRRIQTNIPTAESLGLPKIYSDLVMQKRGLILVVGPTGSGKTTSLASMVGYRNQHGDGHIITVEDPIEYVHAHQNCIVSQRDVGIDTYSFSLALKNALRQRPDVVVIGEIRDREVMEQALYFAETGHLCIATLHASNSNQTIERALNFFPEESHHQIRLNLSLNLKAILSQRLVTNTIGSRSLAVEVMLNNGLIKQLIEEGKIRQIKDMIEKGGEEGMVTFDQSLYQLFRSGTITQDVAIAEADNPANLRLMIKQNESLTRVGREAISVRQVARPEPPKKSEF